MDIARLKQLRPYYANLDDDQIVDLVQKHDYPDRSRDDIAKALGVKLPAPAQPALPERSLFGAINDSVINAANSAAGVVKSGVDLFAPDSLLSQGIADFITMGQEKQSDKQKALNRQLSTDLQNAEGPLDKAGAYVKHALTADPLKTVSDAAGNVLPFMGAGRVLAATRAPGAVATAANMGLAGIVGAGEVRGNIWDKISRTPDADLLEQSPEYAELRIQRGMTEAQAKQELGANLSRNLPEVGAVGALGALSGKFGLEGMAAGVAPKMGRVGSAAVGLADEALQGGAEQVATNKGVQRALPEQSLLDDVPLNMAMEGLGGMLGGAALGGRERVPDAGPLSRAANTALDQREKEQAAQSPLLALPAPTIRVTEGGQAITTDPRMGGVLDVTPVSSAQEAENAEILAAARAAQQTPDQAIEQSQANISMMAGRQQPTSLEVAQARVAGLAEQAGIEASVIPHPSGRGYMVIPSAWVAEPMRQQVQQGQQAGMLPSPDMAAPDAPLVGGAEGLRPQTYAEQQAARQAVRDVMDERDRMASLGLTPDVERARQTRALPEIQSGDITTPKGSPFKTEGQAKLVGRKKSGSGRVMQVRGGWIFRPDAETVEAKDDGETRNPADVAGEPGADRGAPAVSGVADVGPDAAAEQRRVDTAADRLVADSAGDLLGRDPGGRDDGGLSSEQNAPQAAAGIVAQPAQAAESQGADARGAGQDAAGAQAAGVPGTGRPADVQADGVKPKAMPAFLKTKTVPQMTVEELREAQAYYGPNHKRAKAIEKALAKIGPQQAESGEGEKLPPTDIRDGDKVLVDGEVYTVTGSLKEGRKNVGVVADRDSDTDPLNGVKRVMLRGDDAIRAKIAADNLPAVKPSLSVEFGGKTYPVDSVEDAQQKWVKFQETAGAGVSQVGNGVDVKDQTGKVVGRISYNGRAWDADGNLMAEAPAQEAQKKDDAPRYDPAKDPLADKRAPAALAREKDAAPVLEANPQPETQPTEGAEDGRKVQGQAPAEEVSPEARPSLKGEKIDDDWTVFSKNSGTLGIPRSEMPQIMAEHRGALVNFLNARGIGHEADEVPPESLKPTQAEFSPEKVEKAMESDGDRSILVSEDDHVLDGHHQWVAKYEAGEPVKVIRLKAPIRELLNVVAEFPSAEQAAGSDALSTTDPASAIEDGNQSAAGQADETPQITEAEARKRLEWRDLGQSDGTKTWGLYFKDADGGTLRYGTVSKYAGSRWEVDGHDGGRYEGLQPAKKKAEDIAVKRLREHGYVAAAEISQAEPTNATNPTSAADQQPTDAEKRRQGVTEAAEMLEQIGRFYSMPGRWEKELRSAVLADDSSRVLGKFAGIERDTTATQIAKAQAFANVGGMPVGVVRVLDGNGVPVAGVYLQLPFSNQAKDDFWNRQVIESIGSTADIVYPQAKETKPKSAKERIADFGEKLEGARKDYASALKDAMEVDVKAAPLSKSWPEPDYQKLLDGGADPFMVSFIHAARDEIPTKPVKAWKVKGWAAQVEMLRDMAQKILSGEISQQRLRELLAEPKFELLRSRVGGRAELYEAVGHGKSLKGVDFERHDYALYRGEQNVTKWVISQEAKATAFSNWPREIVAADTKDDALAQFKAKYDDLDLGPKAKGQPQFDIYRRRGTEGAIIGKKIGREYIDLKKFADVKEARAYLQDNLAELEKALEQYKATPLERRPDNQPRVGEDHRNGAPVTPEVFAETFGFRGVQFGNYVEQARRQSDLNEAYDALMDLAAVLGVPPRALSLNGTLGLAFGARGKGGKGAPIAHFEGDKVVINLTKAGGPGSLAHEWWHSVDNYFARQSVEKSTDFVTGGAVTDRMRQKLREAFAAVKVATQAPTLRRRAALLDKRKSKPYWNTPVELSARAFESYVIAKLQDQGAANDYLANIVDPEVWGVSESMRADALGQAESETYPYPLPAELPAVRAAFDDFFKTVETRTDDAGNVAMFSRRSATGSALPDAIIGRPLGDLNSHPEYAAAKAGDPAAALAVAEDLVTEDMVSKVKALGDGVVVVPVVSVEAAGRNKIPLAVAEVLADRAGLKTDAAIVQTNSPKRTGMDGLDRLLSPPEFDGPVVAGKSYVLVDDTITQGGTFAALASHIADNGGIVSGVISLTGKQYSARIAPSQDLLEQVRAKFGDIESDFRAATGYGFDALTESEARYLARHDSPQRIRNRIAEAGGAASQRLDEGRTGEAQRLTARKPTAESDFKRGDGLEEAVDFDYESLTARAEEAHVQTVETLVLSIVRSWKNAPEIVVLSRLEQAPVWVQQENERQIAGGAQGVPDAFFYGGKAYIMASEMKTIADVRKAVFHEVLGHLGLRGLYGKQLDKILAQVWAVRRDQVVDKGLSYGMDMNERRDQLKAAEEVLAEMAETNPSLGFVRRAIAAIRSWLRVNVPALSRMKMTDDEIINEFILPAQRFIKRGPQGPDGRMAPAFRRGDAGMQRSEKADIGFSRTATAEQYTGRARELAQDFLGSAGTKVDWLDRTFKTQYAKAQKFPEFGKVFNRLQQYIESVSSLANQAADRAPSILPKLESVSDLWKHGIWRHGLKAEDKQAIAAPIFEGTLEWARKDGALVRVAELEKEAEGLTTAQKEGRLLRDRKVSPEQVKAWKASKLDVYEGAITNAYEREYLAAGVVFTDAELRDRFGLTPEQIGQYREFRAAVDESLDEMAAAEVVRLVPDLPADVAAMAETAEGRKGLREAVEAFLGDKNNDLWNQVQDKFNQVEKLKERGYAPLSRFGKFYVHVVDAAGATQFFGLAETSYKANALAREMRGAFPDATVDQGVMSQQQYKLMSAVPLDSMELFAQAIGADQSEVFQKYIQLAKNNRSTMKRLIRRKGTAGFSDDVPRVLANFVTSNARAASAALHVKTAKEMAQEIQAGDVKDEAVKLIEAVTEPEESGAAIRGLMFMNFIAGSIASALVNTTQPVTMTLPYLSQWGGAGKAAARLVEGARMAVTRAGGDAELRAALKRAADDGLVSPQEIHHLIQRATGGLADKNPIIQKLAFVWSAPFSLAEQFNRRATFIAAYRTAKEEGIGDPFQFAEKAVIETQGLYNCVDQETECLTASGWKRHTDLIAGEVVYAVDEHGRLVESRLIDVHRHSGPAPVLEFSGRYGFSMVLTPNHDVVVQNYSARDKKWRKARKVKAGDLKNHQIVRVPFGDATGRQKVLSDDEVAFLSWVAAEGSLFAHRGSTEKRGVQLVQSQSHNPAYVDEIRGLLKRLGYGFNEYARRCSGGGTMVRWRVGVAGQKLVANHLAGKQITMDLVQKLTTDQMNIFLHTFCKADGHFRNEAEGGGPTITQKCAKAMDVLQAMAVLSGTSSALSKPTGRDWRVLYLAKDSKRAYAKHLAVSRGTAEMVWCPQTEHGTWIARRNGRTFVTGNSGNKPNWARGVAGATAMTFKQYSVHYLEWLSRMARSGKPGQKAALLALAMLFLAAGADGLPFMDDMDDVIDTVGQAMGYDTNTKRWRHQAAAAILGDELGEVATRGFSAMGGFPIDVSMRMGMGNLLPATDLLMKSNTDTARSLSELAGPGGALFIQYRDAAKAVLAGDLAGAAQKAVPVAMQNVAKAGTMFATGEYRDQRGRKVTDADLLDAGVKALGFQPSQIARESGMLSDLRQSESLARMTEGEITDKWARAIVDGDREAEKEALAMRDDWNEKNPDMPIVVKRSQAIRKARQMRMERKDRFLKTVAPERRKAAQQDLEA